MLVNETCQIVLLFATHCVVHGKQSTTCAVAIIVSYYGYQRHLNTTGSTKEPKDPLGLETDRTGTPTCSLETEKMYKVDLPVGSSIEKAVERQRSAETARKARIFNTRLRVLGIDHDALNQQVQEKKNLKNMDVQRGKAFDKLREYHEAVLLQQDINETEKRTALHTELTRYWATQQRVNGDADVKYGLKGSIRVNTPEGELGPASMKIFQGEDIGEEQRRKEQMKKTDRDLRAQMEANERKHVGDKHREMLLTKELVRQDLQGVHLRALEEESKKAARNALDNYNQILAAECAEAVKQQHRREECENLAEMQHTLTSDMMTECAQAAKRDVGGAMPPRVLVDRWKGMSPEQLSAIHKEREEQRLERQRQLKAEQVQDAAYGLQLLKLARQEEEEEMRVAQLRREKRIQTDHYNMRLAREQQAYQEYLNKKLYTNKPSKDYFHQFNTSSR